MTHYEKYQTRHRIKPNTAYRPTGRVMVCAVDTIRIHPNARGNGWTHDQGEIKDAASRHNWAERKDLL